MIGLLRRRGRDISCEQAVALVTAYLDGALAPAQQSRLERHLAGCPHCTEYLAQIRVTIGLAQGLRSDEMTAQTREHFVELYRRWLSDGE